MIRLVYLVSLLGLLCTQQAVGAGYAVEEPKGIGAVDWPTLPDLSGYTGDALVVQKDKLCEGKTSTKSSSVVRMLSILELYGLTDSRLIDLWVSKQKRNPRILSLKQGCFYLSELVRKYPRIFIKNKDDSYTARLPIVVLKGAVLVLEDITLKLSTERGSFISNSGEFFSIDSSVIGWSEAANGPSKFIDAKKFRPFYIGWGGSRSWMLRSRFAYLGYSKLKSYGVSFSQYGVKIKGMSEPTAWIIDCTFDRNYYGFYTWEARDIVLLRSKYFDNIVYGIDPHDFSHGLIVAYNEVSGTREKHGLIFSRGVVDSWIIGNYLHHNNGSGLVMDRQASRNHIINNVSSANEGDGFSFYESPDNYSVGNVMKGNKRHGFFIRNSINTYSLEDTIQSNGRVGIIAFSEDIQSETRDYKRDPFETRVSFGAYKTKIHDNKTGVFSTRGNLEWMEIIEPDIKGDVAPVFRGSLNYLEEALVRKLYSESRQIRVSKPHGTQDTQGARGAD